MGLFEGDRRAQDRARAEAAMAGSSACAVATGLLNCAMIDARGAHDQAYVSCPFADCPSRGEAATLSASKHGRDWRCGCGVRQGDTINLVRDARALSFGEAVKVLGDFVDSAHDENTGDLFL